MPVKPFHWLIAGCFLLSCQNKQDGTGHPDFIFLSGRYIGKETCLQNTENDYHLIEIIVPRAIGDSIVYDSSPYLNVLKAKGVRPEFQHPGTMIGFDATISKERVFSSPCDLNPSLTYPLYEILIIRQIPYR